MPYQYESAKKLRHDESADRLAQAARNAGSTGKKQASMDAFVKPESPYKSRRRE